jgi:Flp pilus assembly protein TadG
MRGTLRNNLRLRGATIIYMTVVVLIIVAFVSLAVDYGRVQLAKTELQRAADAAARYGAAGLITSNSTARTNAVTAAGENSADGTKVVIKSSDVTLGYWNASTRTFQTSAAAGLPRAVRVTASRSTASGDPIKLFFGSLIGRSTFDLDVDSTAAWYAPIDVNVTLGASANPWLAGMPNGTLANPTPPSGSRRDRAGPYTDSKGVFHPTGESPAALTGITLVPGEALTFDAISGTGTNGSGLTVVGPDGNTGQILSNDAGAEHGKSNITAPINAVIGVFLDDSVPSGTTPPNLNFSTAASRDFETLSPKLRQMFFLGDGKTSTGVQQQFVVPPGATRLFIGKMDGYEWNNNIGSSNVTFHRVGTIQLVK